MFSLRLGATVEYFQDIKARSRYAWLQSSQIAHTESGAASK